MKIGGKSVATTLTHRISIAQGEKELIARHPDAIHLLLDAKCSLFN